MAPSSLVVPEDAALTRFAGFVRVGDDEFKVAISHVRYAAADSAGKSLPRMLFDRARVDAEPPLAALLKPHEHTLKVRLLQASSLEGFLRELEELVAVSAAPSVLRPNASNTLPDAEYYNRLMEEIDAVGWRSLAHLSDDLRVVELQANDAAGRSHTIRVELAADYPLTAPRCAVDAPEEFKLNWPLAKSANAYSGRRATTPADRPTLKTILDQFETFLNEYQAFWNVLDEIDACCCVLEPQHPSRATGRRRLAIQRHVSVQVEVDPTHPRSACELKFFGSEATVAPLRERWSDHLFEWEDHRSLPQNLEILLDVELPSPKTAKTEEFALECGICYTYRLEIATRAAEDATTSDTETATSNGVQTMIPDRLCENPKCNRPFHEKCLFEWLKALPTARQSFSTVFGECPYCREAIGAKFVA